MTRLTCLICLLGSVLVVCSDGVRADDRPNILLAISDDQSFAHTSIAGLQGGRYTRLRSYRPRRSAGFATPSARRRAASPSRASLLTGRHTWQLEQAGTHASEFPKKFVVYPDFLEAAGYFVGQTGKAWGPGNWEVSGRVRNPAGPAFQDRARTHGTSRTESIRSTMPVTFKTFSLPVLRSSLLLLVRRQGAAS